MGISGFGMDGQVARRLGVLQGHVLSEDHQNHDSSVAVEGASGKIFPQVSTADHYGVFLPEKLSADGPWNVVR